MRVAEVAGSLGLVAQLHQRADALSGGQRRRLHTGMALLHRPRVLFLDEPTVGADVTSRTGILDIVRTMASQGTTIVYTTHYLTELEILDAHIAVLDQGRIVADAPLGRILATYATATATL
jgi:ABC-2 type transport system ATP-binding protein